MSTKFMKRLVPKTKILFNILLVFILLAGVIVPILNDVVPIHAANERYFVMGQVYFADGTANCNVDGRVVADTAFTVAAAGNFVITMANGTTGTVTGTNVTGSPVALSAGANTITCSDAVADGNFDITIGTAANWNTVNSWSAASGGVCGASVPDATNSVLFDSNSFTAGSQVLTVDATAYCLSMDWTGATNTPTLAFSTFYISVSANITLINAMAITCSGSSGFSLAGTTILTTNGLDVKCRISVVAGGSLTLADNYTGTGAYGHLTVSQGVVNTAGFTVNINKLLLPISGATTLTLGSSIVTLTSDLTYTGTLLTVTANTATINISGTGACALGNANWNGASFNLVGTAHTVSGSPTGIATFTISSGTTQTITITAGNRLTCTTATLSGDATHAHTIKSGTAGTLASIWATNKTDDYVTYTDILRNYNGVIVADCSGAGGGTFAGGGGSFTSMTIQGAGAYALTVTGNNTFNTFQVDASLADKTIIATGTTQTVNNFKRESSIGSNIVTMTGGTWTKTGGKLVNGTGTFTGSTVTLPITTTTVVCTGAGTATITLPAGVSGTATSGTATLAGSPQALVAGANTIDTGATTGDFTIALSTTNTTPIALNYLGLTNCVVYPANVWYAGDMSTDNGGNTNWIFTQVDLTGLISTQAATGITMNKDGVTGVTFNGTIAQIDGTPTITIKFEYGLTPAYGSSTADVIVYASGNYTANPPTNLIPGQTYHYRFVGTNSNGTTNGADQTFDFTMPSITTGTATDLTNHSATLVGNISSMGDATSTYAWFEWGLTNAYGNSTALQTISGIGNVSGDPTGLLQGTTYHYRMNVTNGATTVNGSDVTFTPIAYTGGNNLAVIALPIIFLVAIIFGMLRFVTKSEEISNNKILLLFLIVIIVLVGLALLGVVQATLNVL